MTPDDFGSYLRLYEELFPGAFPHLTESQVREHRKALAYGRYTSTQAQDALRTVYKGGHYPTLGLVLGALDPPDFEYSKSARAAAHDRRARENASAFSEEVNRRLASLPEIQILGLHSAVVEDAPDVLKPVYRRANPKAGGATPLRVAMYEMLTPDP